MKKLSDLFEVTYGNKFDLNKMKLLPRSSGGINFVGRSSQNHGVSGTVAPVDGVEPLRAGFITVALGGTKLLSSFIQQEPFYTAQNVAVLNPIEPMSFPEKLFVCLCIRHNRFRYSAFGREANRTVRELLLPDPAEYPAWLNEVALATVESKSAAKLNESTPSMRIEEWKAFRLADLFTFKKGKRLTKANMRSGQTPFIGSIDGNNGVSARIDLEPTHKANTITVNYNGSVAESFYQPSPFCASDDVNVLYPQFKMTPAIALFFVAVIRREKYRFNYGRKWHLERMGQTEIKLPVTRTDEPDFEFIERFMNTIPFSSQLSN